MARKGHGRSDWLTFIIRALRIHEPGKAAWKRWRQRRDRHVAKKALRREIDEIRTTPNRGASTEPWGDG